MMEEVENPTRHEIASWIERIEMKQGSKTKEGVICCEKDGLV